MIVSTVDQARKRIGRSSPAAVFLDESAIDIEHAGETLESAVALLTEIAPVVVAATPEKQSGLAFLITSGAVDFVARTADFLPWSRECWTAVFGWRNGPREWFNFRMTNCQAILEKSCATK